MRLPTSYCLLPILVIITSCSAIRNITNNQPDLPLPDKYESMKFGDGNITIAPEFTNPETYTLYKKELCFQIKEAVCRSNYNSVLKARLKEKYYMAKAEAFDNHCTAHPIECKNPSHAESVFISLHNYEVEAYKAEEVAMENARQEQQRQSMWRGIANGFQQMEQNRLRQEKIKQQNAPVYTNCRTDNYGNTRCTTSR